MPVTGKIALIRNTSLLSNDHLLQSFESIFLLFHKFFLVFVRYLLHSIAAQHFMGENLALLLEIFSII